VIARECKKESVYNTPLLKIRSLDSKRMAFYHEFIIQNCFIFINLSVW